MTGRTVSIVVPAFNEERRVPALLAALGSPELAEAGMETAEVIVVDDRSSDRTAAVLVAWAPRLSLLRVVRLERNRGKGAAVRSGVLEARSPLVLVTDVDLSTPLAEARKLLEAIDDGHDIAIGSRALPESRILVHQARHRELMGKTFNLALRVLTGLEVRDSQCGFKLFGPEAVLPLFERQRITGFAFDAEILLAAHGAGLRVTEVPVRWINDPDTRVHLLGGAAAMGVDRLRVAWRARTRRV